MFNKVRAALQKHASKDYAKKVKMFFKTGKNQYAQNDVFIGLKVPQIRKVVQEFHKNLEPIILTKFLESEIHEERIFSVLC